MSDILIVTTTRYSSTGELRYDLACRMVGAAVGQGYEVAILDDSSNDEVFNGLGSIGARMWFPSTTGMSAQRRELFQRAPTIPTNPKYFLWTEPEKADLVRHIPQIASPLRSGKADIVVVGRTEASWATCPALQAESERRANAVYREVIGLDLDPMRGPVAFNLKALPFFQYADPERYGVNSGYIQHLAPIEAYAAGLKVVGVNVDFFYPLAQRMQEEGELVEQMKVKWPRQFDECTAMYRSAAKAYGLPKK